MTLFSVIDMRPLEYMTFVITLESGASMRFTDCALADPAASTKAVVKILARTLTLPPKCGRP